MKKPLIYLASPYSDDEPGIIAQRVRAMEVAVATLIRQNLIIPYSPIVYTHPIADYMDDDFDWYSWDLEMLDRCDGMIVCQLPGWEDSKGVKIEIDHCVENKIPFVYANLQDVIFQCATDILEAIKRKERDSES